MSERLTERDEYGNADIIGVDSSELQGSLEFDELNLVTNALNKLADYEDAEREGRVVVLPCREGTIVYGVVDVVSQGYPDPTITPTVFEKRFELSDIRRYGKSIFLLPEQAEAERALAATEPKGGLDGK